MRKVIYLSCVLAFILVLSGCATTSRKQLGLENQALRNQVTVLKTDLDQKDQEIENLKESLDTISQQVAKKTRITEIKSRPKIKDIQIALRNAGYNPGVIDGKMGKQTRNAIKAFQKANNLRVDGQVGKGTWRALSQYYGVKVK